MNSDCNLDNLPGAMDNGDEWCVCVYERASERANARETETETEREREMANSVLMDDDDDKSLMFFFVLLFDIKIKFCCGHNCTFFQIHYFIICEKMHIKFLWKFEVLQLYSELGGNNSDTNFIYFRIIFFSTIFHAIPLYKLIR